MWRALWALRGVNAELTNNGPLCRNLIEVIDEVTEPFGSVPVLQCEGKNITQSVWNMQGYNPVYGS